MGKHINYPLSPSYMSLSKQSVLTRYIIVLARESWVDYDEFFAVKLERFGQIVRDC